MSTRVHAERYELLERLGRGAMGEVWAAIDRRTGADVAVKISHAWAAAEPELCERFEREGKLLKRLKSPFICSLVDSGRGPDGIPFIVLERLTGETLEQLLAREGYLPMSDVERIGDEILQALVVAHGAGIVHRDLGPANVFLHRTRDGKTLTKILDFGIAKSSDTGAPRTADDVTMGTLAYVAPEQLGDSAKAGPRADLYAVGTLVFRALTGQMPFGSTTGTALVVMKREHDAPSIDEATGEKWPAALRTFLTKTLARTPGKRYLSAEVALAAWRDAMRGKGPRLAAPDRPNQASRTLTLDDNPPRDAQGRPAKSRTH